MRHRHFKYISCVTVMVIIYYFFGVGDYLYSRSFDEDFDYPLNIELLPVVQDVLAGRKTSVNPINFYLYRFLSNSGKCKVLANVDLFIAVKSAVKNYEHRMAIRDTYGQEDFIRNKTVRVLFFLGLDGSLKSDAQKKVDNEMILYKDIIQMDFQDSYYNNTIKTVMMLHWLYDHCPNSKYYFFTDDDMYISTRNVFKYINRLDVSNQNVLVNKKPMHKITRGDLHYVGYTFRSTPHRHVTSKWRVSLEEYPWNKWPPYVTAGAFLLSNKCMRYMYVGSLYIKHFRFDDIYLGIVAKKLGIELTHSPHFYFYKKRYSKESYRNVIASHGFDDHEELLKVWKEQNGVIEG